MSWILCCSGSRTSWTGLAGVFLCSPCLQWVCRCFELHFFAFCNISRRDEALFGLKKNSGLPGEDFKDFTTSVIEYNTKVSFCFVKRVNILWHIWTHFHKLNACDLSVYKYSLKSLFQKQKDGTFCDGRKLLQKKILIALKSQNSQK